MPYIHVTTNEIVPEDVAQSIKTELGRAIEAIPGKTEGWLMVSVTPEALLWFQGTDEPAAMVEVSVYGGADSDDCDALTGRICDILQGTLGLDAARIYVKHTQTPDWGWNGRDF